MSGNQMSLGVVLMDDHYAVEGGPAELAAVEFKYPWVMMSDDGFWGIPIHTAVARGADAPALLGASDAGAAAVAGAVERLDGRTQLILGNCGFMWSAARRISEGVKTPTITSALEFLDLALRMTSAPVGIMTYNAASLDLLLTDHPDRERIRVLGLSDLPAWSAVSAPDWLQRGGWTFVELEAQMLERLALARAPGGMFEPMTILILECTFLPSFRSRIRAVAAVPVLDIVSFAAAALS